jgi:hypothetical protein
MEIRYTSLAPTERTIEVTETEIRTASDLIYEYFLSMLPHIDFDSRTLEYQPAKKAIFDFAAKYGVPTDHQSSMESFYRAVLDKPGP